MREKEERVKKKGKEADGSEEEHNGSRSHIQREREGGSFAESELIFISRIWPMDV